jgi:type IV pilus assembly protein PilE
MRKRQSGVTLIELMTVVIIVGILASIAVPSYRSYLLRSQRTDARTALLRIQSAQEKYLVQNGKYTEDLEKKPSEGGLGLYTVSEQGMYDLSVKFDADGNGYTATATAKTDKGQKDDKTCRTFTINAAGARTAKDTGSNDKTAECWR